MASDDAVDTIALELTRDGYVRTPSRTTPGGAVSWRLTPPAGGQDAFVTVELHPNELRLTSWSGWRMTADPVSGQETGRAFTK